MKLYIPVDQDADAVLQEEIAFLGRCITISDWTRTWCYFQLAVGLGEGLAAFLFQRYIPVWLAIPQVILSFVPLILLFLRKPIARRCKWIPEAD